MQHPSSWSQRALSIMVLVSLFLVGCGAESAQQETKSYTIGIVSLVDLGLVVDGFKAGMADAGYVEGQNVTYIYDGPTNSMDGLAPAIQSLIDADVDLIFAITTPAALVAKELTANNPIPVVFAPLVDPVGAGVVPSLEHPGGNLTGVTSRGSEARRLEMLTRLAPDVARPVMPYNPNDPAALSASNTMIEAADKLGLELMPYPINDEAALDAFINDFPEDADALILLADSLVTTRADDFVVITYERKIPMTVSNIVDQGALMAYGANFYAVGEQSARLSDKILKGANPADIPVETAEFFLQINMKAAEAIGLELSDDILRQASTIVR